MNTADVRMRVFRVLVTGSRSWVRSTVLEQVLDGLRAEHARGLLVVHGGCPHGADAIADRWARRHHVDVEVHPADWNRHGRRAGLLRNTAMVRAGADLCVAFIRDASPGATQCADTARRAGIPVRAHTHDSADTGARATSSVIGCALHAAARGWAVFPLTVGGKFPIIRAAHPPGHPCRGECGRDGHGFHDATTNPARIGAWWRAFPRANYGISTGPAGLVVIDLDTGKGTPPARVLPDQGEQEATPAGIVDGADVLTWAAERAGADVGWGDTLTVRTPSGGTHLYYTAPEGVEIRSSAGHSGHRITGLGWSVDVRAVGGYVVGPGSLGPSRNSGADGYAAIIKGAVAPLPGWLLTLLSAIGSVGDRTPCITGSDRTRPGSAPGPRIGAGTGYAAAALAGELANIAASQPGDKGGSGRNTTLNRAAYKLGRLLDTCDLDPDHVTAELLTAGQAVGLGEREARTAIASGLAQGRAHPRTTRPRSTQSLISGGKP